MRWRVPKCSRQVMPGRTEGLAPPGWGAAMAALMTLVASSAGADGAGASRALPLFSISKSENKNQVQYAIRVDDRCEPATTAPVFAYWRMLEKGPTVTEPLLAHEPMPMASRRKRRPGRPTGTACGSSCERFALDPLRSSYLEVSPVSVGRWRRWRYRAHPRTSMTYTRSSSGPSAWSICSSRAGRSTERGWSGRNWWSSRR